MGKYFNKENFFIKKTFFSSSSFVSPPLTRTLPVQGYGSMSRIGQFEQPIQPVQPTPILTPAGKISNIFYARKYYLLIF